MKVADLTQKLVGSISLKVHYSLTYYNSGKDEGNETSVFTHLLKRMSVKSWLWCSFDLII